MRSTTIAAIAVALALGCGSESDGTGSTAQTSDSGAPGPGGTAGSMASAGSSGAGGIAGTGGAPGAGGNAGAGGGGRIVDAGGVFDAADARIQPPLGDGSAGLELCSKELGSRLRIRGTLGGKPVDVSQLQTTHSFRNGTVGTLDIPLNPDPSLIQVHFRFPLGGVPYDKPSLLEGTLRLRPTDPMGGVDICAGRGSTAFMPDDGNIDTSEMSFELFDMTLGPACTEPVQGHLVGCWTSNL